MKRKIKIKNRKKIVKEQQNKKAEKQFFAL